MARNVRGSCSDIVASHLGNDPNVGLYQRTFGEHAEAACRQDRADDVRTVFGWAVPCDTRPTAATSDTLPATFHDLAQVESSVRMVLVRDCRGWPARSTRGWRTEYPATIFSRLNRS